MSKDKNHISANYLKQKHDKCQYNYNLSLLRTEFKMNSI